ncbi:hypothetical protein ANN_09145 [Periplaneta americana]|uniref:Uncharacterized protein n=1 Tax=Periplaneta americana TaxID=6978 RepID=A0ABQ8TKJ7_PERAM|nr:hypothetical protein ANN_09145 [Periplaneta americana]
MPLGRPRRRWEDNIKMDLREVGYDGRLWINVAQDRDRWWAYVRATVNLLQRIPNLTGPVNNNDVTLQQNRNKTSGRIDGCHGDCVSGYLCYASKILRNFRPAISFKEKRA